MHTIVLTTDLKLGDTVVKKIDSDKQKMIVTGFIIHAIDEVGQVIHFSILCSDGDGSILDYKTYEIEQYQTTY
jgi:hypothetical protein